MEKKFLLHTCFTQFRQQQQQQRIFESWTATAQTTSTTLSSSCTPVKNENGTVEAALCDHFGLDQKW